LRLRMVMRLVCAEARFGSVSPSAPLSNFALVRASSASLDSGNACDIAPQQRSGRSTLPSFFTSFSFLASALMAT